MKPYDEVDDPEWLIEWSMAKWEQVRNYPRYRRQPMIAEKSSGDEPDRVHDPDHNYCLDSGVNSARVTLGNFTEVRVYDADGNFLRTETIQLP